MLVFLLAAVATAIPAPPPPPPIELWHGAISGMSPAQVQALFPKGRQPQLAVGYPPVPNMVEGGGGAGYAVDEDIFGHSAVATYYFQAGRLLEVIVDVKNMGLRRTRDNVDVARQIEGGLTNYYGPPKVCADTDKRGLARLDCRWTVRSLQVGMSYVDYGGLSPSLTIAARSLAPKRKVGPAIFPRRGVR
ncbi:MAG: hypothetical protein WA840_15780 [Caulobacteraceae bacterium]